MPVIIGSTTESTAAAATAASIALPPCSSTPSAASVASGWLVAAAPCGAYTGDRPAMVGDRGAWPAAAPATMSGTMIAANRPRNGKRSIDLAV